MVIDLCYIIEDFYKFDALFFVYKMVDYHWQRYGFVYKWL